MNADPSRDQTGPMRILLSEADVSQNVPAPSSEAHVVTRESSYTHTTTPPRRAPSRESSFRKHARLTVSPQDPSVYSLLERSGVTPTLPLKHDAEAPAPLPLPLDTSHGQDDDFLVEVEVFPHTSPRHGSSETTPPHSRSKSSPHRSNRPAVTSVTPVVRVVPSRESSYTSISADFLPIPPHLDNNPNYHHNIHQHNSHLHTLPPAPSHTLTVPVPDYLLSAAVGPSTGVASPGAETHSLPSPPDENSSLSVWGRSLRLVKGMFSRRSHIFSNTDAYISGWRLPFSLSALHASSDIGQARATAVTALRGCFLGDGCENTCGYKHYGQTFERVRESWRGLRDYTIQADQSSHHGEVIAELASVGASKPGHSHQHEHRPHTQVNVQHTSTPSIPQSHSSSSSSMLSSSLSSLSSPSFPPFPLPPLLLTPPSLPLLLFGAGALVAHTAYTLHPGAPPPALYVADLPLVLGGCSGEFISRYGQGQGENIEDIAYRGYTKDSSTRKNTKNKNSESPNFPPHNHPHNSAYASAHTHSHLSHPTSTTLTLPSPSHYRFAAPVPWAQPILSRLSAFLVWCIDAHVKVKAHLIALDRVQKAIDAAWAKIKAHEREQAKMKQSQHGVHTSTGEEGKMSDSPQSILKPASETLGTEIPTNSIASTSISPPLSSSASPSSGPTSMPSSSLAYFSVPPSSLSCVAATILLRACQCDCEPTGSLHVDKRENTKSGKTSSPAKLPPAAPLSPSFDMICPCIQQEALEHVHLYAATNIPGASVGPGKTKNSVSHSQNPFGSPSHPSSTSHDADMPPLNISAAASAIILSSLSRGEGLLATHQHQAARKLAHSLILCTYRHHMPPLGAVRLADISKLRAVAKAHCPASDLTLPNLYAAISGKTKDIAGNAVPKEVYSVISQLHDTIKERGGWYTSDSGWGCTLRSGQMVLANVLMRHFAAPSVFGEVCDVTVAGSDTRVTIPASPLSPTFFAHTSNPYLLLPVMQWLYDSPIAPYSLHAIMLHADRACGQWYGPGEVMGLLRKCVAAAAEAAAWSVEKRLDHERNDEEEIAAAAVVVSQMSIHPRHSTRHQNDAIQASNAVTNAQSGAKTAVNTSISGMLASSKPLAVAGDCNITVHVAVDGCIFLDDVREAMRIPVDNPADKNNKTTNNPAATPGALAQRSCIIAVPLRLGVDVIPAALHEHVKICLKSRFSAGIVGGAPRSSYYFYGYQGSRLLYLDPHKSQPIQFVDLETLQSAQDNSYAHDDILSIDVADLDPSLCVCYFVRDAVELREWAAEIADIGRSLTALHGGVGVGSNWLFSVFEEKPAWMRMDDEDVNIDVDSGDDMSGDDAVHVGGRKSKGRGDDVGFDSQESVKGDGSEEYIDEWTWWPQNQKKSSTPGKIKSTGSDGDADDHVVVENVDERSPQYSDDADDEDFRQVSGKAGISGKNPASALSGPAFDNDEDDDFETMPQQTSTHTTSKNDDWHQCNRETNSTADSEASDDEATETFSDLNDADVSGEHVDDADMTHQDNPVLVDVEDVIVMPDEEMDT